MAIAPEIGIAYRPCDLRDHSSEHSVRRSKCDGSLDLDFEDRTAASGVMAAYNYVIEWIAFRSPLERNAVDV